MGRVVRSRAELHVPGLVGTRLLAVGDEGDGLVGEVLRHVVAVLGQVRLVDVVVVLDEVGIPLVRLAADEAVEAVEAPRDGPLRLRRAHRPRVGRDVVVLADPERVVAPLAQHLGQERVLHRDVGVRPGVARGRLGDAGVAVLVVVASGEEARPGGRAQRGGVPLRVGEALVREPLHRGHVDAPAVGRPRREPGVVVEDDQDVRRALRRRRLRVRSPVGRRVADVDVDDPVEGLAHGRAPWFEGPRRGTATVANRSGRSPRGSVSRSRPSIAVMASGIVRSWSWWMPPRSPC